MMIRHGVMGAVLAMAAAGCASQRGTGGSGVAAKPAAGSRSAKAGALYLDSDLGFEIGRPSESWQLDATGEMTAEGLAIPVVMRHRESGAQVVLQVAPAIASPTEMAERLTAGLRSQPGFRAGDPEPLALREGAVGFAFEMGESVRGRVAVLEGGQGQIFVMLATWPRAAEAGVTGAVEQIFSSLRPIPKT
ncbi:MAG TPA: hypothetical protein VIG99_06655 [Myxococcaceae bacterium]|jgi:hypothetical protein